MFKAVHQYMYMRVCGNSCSASESTGDIACGEHVEKRETTNNFELLKDVASTNTAY